MSCSILDINNLTFNNSKITIILDDKNEPWFKAKDVACALEYEKKSKAYCHIDDDDRKILEELKPDKPLSYNEKNTIYINKQGVESLLIKTRKIIEDNLVNDMITKLDLNINKIIKTKEQDTIGKIITVFKNLNYKTQYKIDNYKIDLYFIDYKLAIECDEHGHSSYNEEKERERERYITKQLNCTFIRFNPDDKTFDIFKIINKIFLFIHSKDIK